MSTGKGIDMKTKVMTGHVGVDLYTGRWGWQLSNNQFVIYSATTYKTYRGAEIAMKRSAKRLGIVIKEEA